MSVNEFGYQIGMNTKRLLAPGESEFWHAMSACSHCCFTAETEEKAMSRADTIVAEEIMQLKDGESFGATLYSIQVKPSKMIKNYSERTKAEYLAEKAGETKSGQ